MKITGRFQVWLKRAYCSQAGKLTVTIVTFFTLAGAEYILNGSLMQAKDSANFTILLRE